MAIDPFENLEQDSTGFMRASVVVTMAELDIATEILKRGNKATTEEIAKACACDTRGMEALLDSLSALGYLKKNEPYEDASYSVSDQYIPLLDSRNKESYIPMLRHRACMQRNWSRLSFAVREGKPQKEKSESFLGEKTDNISFIAAMNAIALRLTKFVIENLDQAGIFAMLPISPNILDIGGASGTYTEAFLKRLPQANATIFDLPVAITLAKKRFIGSIFEKRIHFLEGDFTKRGFPENFDFAWISAIIHQMGRSEFRDLLQKTYAALKSGGLIAIRDFVMDKSRTNPLDGSLFGINMLVATENGRVYSFDEIEEDLTAIGFTEVKRAVSVDSMASVVTAKKAN